MLVDVIVVVLIVLFTLAGLKAGFIKTLGGFLGSIIGFIAGAFITDWLIQNVGIFQNLVVALIAFIVIAGIIIQIIELIFGLLDTAYKFLAIIPFLKPINNLLGGIFGLIESIVVLGAFAVFVAQMFPATGLNLAIDQSTILPLIAKPFGTVVELFLK